MNEINYEVTQLLKVQDEIGYAQGEIRYYTKNKNYLGMKQAKAHLRKLKKKEKRMRYGDKESTLPV